jgi:hypothetical protein
LPPVWQSWTTALARGEGFGDSAGMNDLTALRVSSVVLAISLMALGSDIGVYLFHVTLAPKYKTALDVAAFIWPLALVFVGTYRRRLQASPPESRNPPV